MAHNISGRSRAAFAISVLSFSISAYAGIGVMWSHPDYGKRVYAALALLREKAPGDYKLVEKYIGRIKEVEGWHLSGMAPYTNPPTFSLSITSARVSLTWCAGAIAHDACHSKQWNDYRRIHHVEWVPDRVWTGQKAELECIAYQIEVMKRIGAPASEIQALQAQDGFHYLEAIRRIEADQRANRSAPSP